MCVSILENTNIINNYLFLFKKLLRVWVGLMTLRVSMAYVKAQAR